MKIVKVVIGIITIIGFILTYKGYENNITVEKLNIDPHLIYRSNICNYPDCIPTFLIQNTGQISAEQIDIFVTPAIVPPSRDDQSIPDNLIIKFALLPAWNPKFDEVKPGEDRSLNFPTDFAKQVLNISRIQNYDFPNGKKFDASTVTLDRILLEIEVKYVRGSDLKKYDDLLFYVQNDTKTSWVDINKIKDTPRYEDFKIAIQKAEHMDLSWYPRIGSDTVYSSSNK